MAFSKKISSVMAGFVLSLLFTTLVDSAYALALPQTLPLTSQGAVRYGRYRKQGPVPIPPPNLSLPNMETSFERLFGVGLAFPYPYFQKPQLRYPVYDQKGKSLSSDSYGFGGPETYHYTRFTSSEGLN